MVLPTRKEHTLEVYKDVAPYTSYKPVTGTAQEVLSRRILIASLGDDRIDELVKTAMQGVSKRHSSKRVVLSEGVVSSPSKELGDFLVVVEYDINADIPWIEIPGESRGPIANSRYKDGEISVRLFRPEQIIWMIPEGLRDIRHDYLHGAYIWPGNFRPRYITTIPV